MQKVLVKKIMQRKLQKQYFLQNIFMKSFKIKGNTLFNQVHQIVQMIFLSY